MADAGVVAAEREAVVALGEKRPEATEDACVSERVDASEPLLRDDGAEPGLGGSAGSLHECPICSEPFASHGDRRAASLHCNHALCRQCAAGIVRRAADRSRLRCPFCRQTTPVPQWEVRRLQEESYGGVYDLEPALDPRDLPESPGLCCGDPCRPGRRRPRSLCLSVTALLLLFLLLLAVFLYMVVPVIMFFLVLANV